MTHRPTLTLAPVAGLILLAGLAGTGCTLESDAPRVVSRPDPVAMATTTAEPFALPPIDRRAPATLETATFALG